MSDGLSDIQKEVVKLVQSQLPYIKSLPEPDRSRGLLCLAYEYFNLDMEERAFPLINLAQPEYFQEQLAKDVLEVPNMREIVIKVADKLMETGYITFFKSVFK